MAVMSALTSAAVLLISPVSVASADVAPGTAQVLSSASAGHAVQLRRHHLLLAAPPARLPDQEGIAGLAWRAWWPLAPADPLCSAPRPSAHRSC